jgi:hypothetical protein
MRPKNARSPLRPSMIAVRRKPLRNGTYRKKVPQVGRNSLPGGSHPPKGGFAGWNRTTISRPMGIFLSPPAINRIIIVLIIPLSWHT